MDVTKRKESEIEPMAELTPDMPEGDGVIAISSDRRVMSANLQAERILKVRLEAGAEILPNQIFPAASLPQAELIIREALQSGHSRAQVEAEITTGEGITRPIVYSVGPLFQVDQGIIGFVLTLHEPVPDAARGLVGDMEYDRLFDHLAEGAFTINNRWRITSFNRRAREITGYSGGDVLGRYCWDVFNSDLCQTDCPLRSTMQTGVTRMDQDVRIVGKKGKRISILVNTSVLRDKYDHIIGAVETFRTLNTRDNLEINHSKNLIQSEIIGKSPVMLRIAGMLRDIAGSDASVVIEGESGTGKELVARAIHNQSARAANPFIAVNTSALAESLLESELFGHEKAAFTGAINSRVGRFELARGGTLFLDEIAEIKPEIQVKLLRVLEERTFERVGGNRPIPLEARIISATNRNLREEVKSGRFREDLFYRLRTVPISLPPLRERTEDIPLLVGYFVDQLNSKYKKRVRGVDPKVIGIFLRYGWPGNIRELQRVLEYAFVFVKGPVITPSHLPVLEGETQTEAASPAPPGFAEEERRTIIHALERVGGSRGEAARLLGISRSSLWRKMKEHGI